MATGIVSLGPPPGPCATKREKEEAKEGEKILVLKWLTEENELDGSGALRNDRGFFCVVAHLPLPMSCVCSIPNRMR